MLSGLEGNDIQKVQKLLVSSSKPLDHREIADGICANCHSEYHFLKTINLLRLAETKNDNEKEHNTNS